MNTTNFKYKIWVRADNKLNIPEGIYKVAADNGTHAKNPTKCIIEGYPATYIPIINFHIITSSVNEPFLPIYLATSEEDIDKYIKEDSAEEKKSSLDGLRPYWLTVKEYIAEFTSLDEAYLVACLHDLQYSFPIKF